MASIANFLRDDRGQDLIEYALLAAFVSLVAIAGATLLGVALNNWYDAAAKKVEDGSNAGS